MHKRMLKYLVLLIVIPGLLVTVSCAQKTIPSEPAVTPEPAVDTSAADRAAEMERQKRLAEEKRLQEEALMEARRKAAMREKMEAKSRFLNQDVYFDFDSAALSMEAQSVLRQKAYWLLANQSENALIEGHCDERGTNAYNLALGDRRAVSVKNFLVKLGVAETRLDTVSFGEERPIDTDATEEAWAKNRRAHFSLK